ncbi:MAG TPA: iron-containing alcohol dehydrogenase [Thermoanaerobaculia bacterium]|nr:iron-containing alcohol dehydrogenase [Thermoanaerobaculia bacterium]
MPFRAPTRLTLAPGSLTRLPLTLEPHRRALLVFDRGLGATPWPQRAASLLEAAGLAVGTFDTVEPNPRDATVEAIAEVARTGSFEVVVGLGGGSVLDAAKAAAMLATNPGRLTDFEGRNRFGNPSLPFVAVPTTCGTGSEVTWVSVITVPERRAKISVKGDGMYPREALVDADLIASLPRDQVAWTGLDALTHALEATTCSCRNPASDALAEKAITLLVGHLRRAVADIGSDAAAREAVMTGSTVAGLAFGSADVAAVHCLSETLGGFYDLPHGLLNATLLAPVLASHGEAVAGRLAELEAMLDPESGPLPVEEGSERFLRRVESLVADLGVPPLSTLGLRAEDLEEIAARSVANGSNGSNPRPMGKEEYRQILDRLLFTPT